MGRKTETMEERVADSALSTLRACHRNVERWQVVPAEIMWRSFQTNLDVAVLYMRKTGLR